MANGVGLGDTSENQMDTAEEVGDTLDGQMDTAGEVSDTGNETPEGITMDSGAEAALAFRLSMSGACSYGIREVADKVRGVLRGKGGNKAKLGAIKAIVKDYKKTEYKSKDSIFTREES